MNFEDLLGKTLTKIERAGSQYDDELIFVLDTGERYRMYHYQDCCEGVHIEDICGNLDDLTGTPLTMAEEVTNSETNPDGVDVGYQESFTWTFYKLATINGYVTIRWYGSSNGCYSEGVTFEQLDQPAA
jgi:hypothetical protein